MSGTGMIETGESGERMSRGGRRQPRAEGPERRCIVTGQSGPRQGLIRFVRGPGDAVVPDLAERLPGRGVWLTADRALVEKAVGKRLFQRAFRGPAHAGPELAERLEALLAERLVAQIALARKAGQAVTGYEKTRARLMSGAAGVLVEAADGAADGRAKLRRLAPELPMMSVLTAGELGLAFGREFAIHAALDAGGIADRALREAMRLAGLRESGGGGQIGGGNGAVATDADADANGPADGPTQDGG